MYNAFFGLNSTPFNLSPDPSFLYRSAQHEEVLETERHGRLLSINLNLILYGDAGLVEPDRL